MTPEPELALQLARGDTGPVPFGALDLSPETVAARFRWARGRGHPGYLWPDVPMHAWRACLQELERVAARVLEGGEPAVRLHLPGGTDARALGVAAFTSGLAALVGSWVESGRVAAAGDVASILALHLGHGRRRAATLDAALGRALEVLATARVKATVLKGAHTAHEYFPEPGTRPVADIDLLLAPADVGRAEQALRAAGYAGGPRHRRPYRRDWMPPDSPPSLRSLELCHADNPYSIDLHGSVDRDFYGVRTVRFDALAPGATRPWLERHPSADVLAQPLHIAFLATHAAEALHNLTLVRLVELVLVARQDGRAGRLDWDELRDLLERTHALRFVYPAFALAERLAPGTVEARLLERMERDAPPRMLRALERLRPAAAQRLEHLSLDERFMWARGPVEHARRAAHMLVPGSAGGSVQRLRDIYLERVFRVFRGRFSLRGRESGTPGGGI